MEQTSLFKTLSFQILLIPPAVRGVGGILNLGGGHNTLRALFHEKDISLCCIRFKTE